MPFSSTNPVRVNSYTTGAQETPTTVGLAGGGWVTVFNSMNQDGSINGVFSQAYNAAGVAVGGQQQVNTNTQSAQEDMSVAALADGTYVVVWSDSTGDADGSIGVNMRHYSAFGVPLSPETHVNSTAIGQQYAPEVAALPSGGWVVTWAAYSQTFYTDPSDGSQALITDQRIYQQVYNAAGVKVGGETMLGSPYPVPYVWPGNPQFQDDPEITSLADGGWVVTWKNHDPYASSFSIQSQAFDADGTPKGGFVTVSDELGAPFLETKPHIVGLAGGGWVTVWAASGGGNYKIAGQMFDANGVKVGGEFNASDISAGSKTFPQIIALANGGFVVGWQGVGGSDTSGAGLYVRSYGADGTPRDTGPVQVNTFSDNDEIFMSLAALDSGGFVAVYYSAYTTNGPNGLSTDADIYQQVFGADGTKIDSETYVTGVQGIDYDFLGLTQLGDDKWVITYNTKDSGGGVGTDLFQKVYTFVHSAPSGVDKAVNVDVYLQHTFSIADFGFSDLDGDVLNGVKIVSIDNGGVLKLNGVVVQPGTVISADMISQLVWTGNEAGPYSGKIGFQVIDSGGTAYGSFNTDPTTNFVNLVVSVIDAGPENHVGSLTVGIQHLPNLIALSNGDFITVWASTDSSGMGIYFQRYDSTGNAIGAETKVNGANPYGFINLSPSIALLNDGGWVIAWSGADANQYGIYAKRFDAAGNAASSQFAVNAFTTGQQTAPVVIGLDDGGWAIEWGGANANDAGGIVQRIYDKNGVTSGATDPNLDASVNTFTTGSQSQYEVTKLAGGGWVATWVSNAQDPDGSNGIYQQVYSSAGAKIWRRDPGQYLFYRKPGTAACCCAC